VYKTEKEEKLRHKLYLSDLTAVTLLKDPKNKRQNVFGLFSPSKNFHFQAPSAIDAQEWVTLVRGNARIEEEEEEMFLASPVVRRQSYIGANPSTVGVKDRERLASSSPEPLEPPIPHFPPSTVRRTSNVVDSSGFSGNELPSHSDFSDNDMQRAQGASIESLAVQSFQDRGVFQESATSGRTGAGNRSAANFNGNIVENDPDRVVWQGWLWFLRSKGGVRQWKNYWTVLRPRNLILYKDESEYTAQFIVQLSSIVNVVDLDPISRTKTHCMQVITDEKSYRFCAHDEESLVQCLGAFKSLLAKRRELELRAAAASGTTAS